MFPQAASFPASPASYAHVLTVSAAFHPVYHSLVLFVLHRHTSVSVCAETLLRTALARVIEGK